MDLILLLLILAQIICLVAFVYCLTEMKRSSKAKHDAIKKFADDIRNLTSKKS